MGPLLLVILPIHRGVNITVSSPLVNSLSATVLSCSRRLMQVKMTLIVHLLVLRPVILGVHGSHWVEVSEYAMVV